MDEARTLAPTIERWYDENGLAIMGGLEVKVFWYPRDRKSRPAILLYSFKHGPQLALPLGSFSPNFKKGHPRSGIQTLTFLSLVIIINE
jgi:hypothetical protein